MSGWSRSKQDCSLWHCVAAWRGKRHYCNFSWRKDKIQPSLFIRPFQAVTILSQLRWQEAILHSDEHVSLFSSQLSPIIMHMAERRKKKKETEKTQFDWNMDLCRHKDWSSTGVSPTFEIGMKIGIRHHWSLPSCLVWVVLGARVSVPAAFLHRTCAADAIHDLVTDKTTFSLSGSACINRYSSCA